MAREYDNSTPRTRNRTTYEAMIDPGGTVPPQAVELEEAVLGALMLERDSIITVQEFLQADSFYKPEHRTIYAAINELSAELKIGRAHV